MHEEGKMLPAEADAALTVGRCGLSENQTTVAWPGRAVAKRKSRTGDPQTGGKRTATQQNNKTANQVMPQPSTIVMRRFCVILLFAALALMGTAAEQLPTDDAVRIHEFYRLAAQIQDKIWLNWSQAPAPLLLVTGGTEFLTHHPAPPDSFKKIGEDLYSRPRQFPANLQATFPAFGPPAVIVIGEPKETESKTSTPWLITVMHERFHQLQSAQPGYFHAVQHLGLSRGDNTGMWMLNYPFPYEKPEVPQAFSQLRDLLLSTMSEADEKEFANRAIRYKQARRKFFAQVSTDDHKYFSFQLWQEGIARYTQIKAAEAAAQYQPSAEYSALSDYEPFSEYAKRAKRETLDELKHVDLAKSKRTVVYSFAATEGFLLDRLDPMWKDQYFKHPLSMDSLFEK